MLAVVQQDDNWTQDHWVSANSNSNESWINPTLSDPAVVLSQSDDGTVTVLWHDSVYEMQSIDLDFIHGNGY